MSPTQTQQELPVAPHVVAKVVQLAAQPDVPVEALAQVIESDLALCSRVLRAANSSLYAPRARIHSIPHAASFLGIRAVRNIVLCAGVRQLASSSQLRGFPLEVYWECSLRRAAAARCLAARLPRQDPQEAFVLSLCQDLGVLVACLQDPSRAEELGARLSQSTAEHLAAEADEVAHAEVGARLLTEWGFPEVFVGVVRHHHDPEAAPPSVQVGARIAWCAERIADLLTVDDKRAALQAAEAGLAALGLDPEGLPELAEAVAEAVAEAAAVFEFKVGPQPTYQEIAAQACNGMFELNLSYEELTRQLQAALAEKERLSEELRRVNAELALRASHDALTGLPNRRAFDEAFAAEAARAERTGASLSLVILDIDHFKRFNDTYGHLLGDEVLKRVATALGETVRAMDMAARFGGEEFVILLPETPMLAGGKAANRFRKVIEAATVEHDGRTLTVTASLGGATHDTGEPLESLLARADQALYRAKEGGRNRVEWSV